MRAFGSIGQEGEPTQSTFTEMSGGLFSKALPPKLIQTIALGTGLGLVGGVFWKMKHLSMKRQVDEYYQYVEEEREKRLAARALAMEDAEGTDIAKIMREAGYVFDEDDLAEAEEEDAE